MLNNIYIFIAITLDETCILVSVHFLMKNIYLSCDLGCAVGRRTSTLANNVLSVTLVMYRHDVKRARSAFWFVPRPLLGKINEQ